MITLCSLDRRGGSSTGPGGEKLLWRGHRLVVLVIIVWRDLVLPRNRCGLQGFQGWEHERSLFFLCCQRRLRAIFADSDGATKGICQIDGAAITLFGLLFQRLHHHALDLRWHVGNN